MEFSRVLIFLLISDWAVRASLFRFLMADSSLLLSKKRLIFLFISLMISGEVFFIERSVLVALYGELRCSIGHQGGTWVKIIFGQKNWFLKIYNNNDWVC